MNTLFRIIVHVILIAIVMNIIALIIIETHSPYLLLLFSWLSHWHFITYALTTATLLNGQKTLTAITILFILMAALPVPHILQVLMPIAAGILTGRIIHTIIQENAPTNIPPPRP